MKTTLNSIFKYLLILSFLLSLHHNASSTHIKGGEINATKIAGTNTYRITIIGYGDIGSVVPFGGGNNPRLSFGDGQQVDFTNPPAGSIAISNERNGVQKVEISVFHKYKSDGNYIISYIEGQRNGSVINMINSIETDFHIETLLVIDGFLGENSSPRLTSPPINYAAVGVKFIHNPGAFDPDGDSLSYRFVTPMQKKNEAVEGYKRLNDPSFYSDFSEGSEKGTPPSLSINSITGDLVWDAPGDVTNQEDHHGICEGGLAEYTVAFAIDEWRKVNGKYYRIGYTIRDMQIIVCNTDNKPPIIDAIPDICIEVGKEVNETVLVSDPNNHPIELEGFGGVFEGLNNATLTTLKNSQTDQDSTFEFTWSTECLQVRKLPYNVILKATDSVEIGPQLASWQSFQITVLGSAPEGLRMVSRSKKSLYLVWDEYPCSEASMMQIWRKLGTASIPEKACIGIPANAGYKQIDEVNIEQTSYVDDNYGKGLSAGPSIAIA